MRSRVAVLVVVLMFGILLSLRQPAHAIPAFARKYSLPCSACHEAWPKLNDFGIAFRDRGYGRIDAIFHNPLSLPIRIVLYIF